MRLFFLFFLFPYFLFASLDRDLEKFYQKLGSSSHIDRESIYLRQSGGFISGGALSVRNNVYGQKLVHFDLPRIDAGCGGIDIYTGGFSFIGRDEFVKTLKNVASNALGYSFMLGLKTVAPTIAHTMGEMQNFANDVNSIGINSCETAMQLVGGALSLTETASEQSCRKLGVQYQKFDDYLQGRSECSSANLKVMEEIESKAQEEGLAVGPLNLSWQAMKKYAFLKDNPKLAEFMMSLFGSILSVRKDSSSALKSQFLRPLGSEQAYLTRFMRGGAIERYECDEKDKCLNVKITESETFESWLGQTQKRLDSIYAKVLKDEELDAVEKELVAKTRFPLYRLLNVMAAGKIGPEELYYISDLIAKESLVAFLQEMKGHLLRGVEEVKSNMLYENTDDYERFEDGLRDLDILIYHIETKSHQEKQIYEGFISQIERIEKSIEREVFMD